MLRDHKIFREHLQKGKEMVRTGQEHNKITRRHRSTLAMNTLYKGDTKQIHVILILVSLYTEWETRLLL
jgi:hypothetical protein